MLQGEHSAILLTFIKLPFVIKIFILSIFEWPFYTGSTVVTDEMQGFRFVWPKIFLNVRDLIGQVEQFVQNNCSVISMFLQSEWKTVRILISWLLTVFKTQYISVKHSKN